METPGRPSRHKEHEPLPAQTGRSNVAIIKMPPHPDCAFIFVDRRKDTPHRVIANDLVHAELL